MLISSIQKFIRTPFNRGIPKVRESAYVALNSIQVKTHEHLSVLPLTFELFGTVKLV